jgi:integral membrane sensor domain MASE1
VTGGSRPSVGETNTRTRSDRLIRFGLSALAYFVVVRVGAALFTAPTGHPTLFPSAGFLLGWLMVSDRRDWPIIAAFASVAHGLASPLFLTAPLTAAAMAVAEVGSTFACAVIMGGGDTEKDTIGTRRLMRFVFGSLLVSTPLFAVLTTLLWPGERSAVTLGVHAMAYGLGVLIIAPLFFSAEEAVEWWRRPAAREKLELGVAIALVIGFAYVGYLMQLTDPERVRPVNVLLVLPVLWAGMRIGTFAAAWTASTAGLIIEYSISHSTGLFAGPSGSESLHLVSAAMYLSVVITLALTNAVIVGGFRRTLTTLKATERWFRDLANASPLAMLVVEPDENTLFFNKALVDLYGYKPDDIRTVDAFWRLTIPDPDERLAVLREWRARMEEARRFGTSRMSPTRPSPRIAPPAIPRRPFIPAPSGFATTCC